VQKGINPWFDGAAIVNKQQTLLISLGLTALMVVVPTLTGCKISQYKTYTLNHGAVHFSFEYPSCYEKQSEYLQSSELAPIGIRFVHRQLNAPSKDTVFGVSISPPAPEWPDAKGAVARIISLGNTIQVTEQSLITIAGISGELVVYLDSRMPDTPSIREVFFVFDGLLWNIFIYSDVSKADQAKADFNQILQNFKIVE
jgi:hypothetical protein